MAGIGTRVDTSAAVLDKEEPQWAGLIDRKRLNIASGRHCVLGQLYDGYFAGSARLHQAGVPHEKFSGFYINSTIWPLTFIEKLLINAAWRRRIADRLKHPERFAAATA